MRSRLVIMYLGADETASEQGRQVHGCTCHTGISWRRSPSSPMESTREFWIFWPHLGSHRKVPIHRNIPPKGNQPFAPVPREQPAFFPHGWEVLCLSR